MSKDRRKDKRRNIGGPRRTDEVGFGLKNALLAAVVILFLGVGAFFITVMIYNNNLEKLYGEIDEPTQIGQAENQSKETEEASSQIGKTIEELEQETQEMSAENEETTEASTEQTKAPENTEVKQTNNEPKQEEKKAEDKKEDTKKEETKNPEFEKPVEGEKMQEFAKDKLVYSETLKEWVVHTGIDIKAEKTTVVKAAEAGKVIAIKNDPRYGITVIIEHANGFETRYANLLTAEFVQIGEEVQKGQTIGTVGNTATFEILDDAHLHFELLKDGEYQDPCIYIPY